jgi:hypothetical protein
LPPAGFPIVDTTAHRCYVQFAIKKVPQIASINYWAGSGGDTSERGADSAEAHARAILDKHGNIMVLMTHNTDLGDSFEREGDDPQYFYQMSVPGYAFGVNAMLYSLTIRFHGPAKAGHYGVCGVGLHAPAGRAHGISPRRGSWRRHPPS